VKADREEDDGMEMFGGTGSHCEGVGDIQSRWDGRVFAVGGDVLREHCLYGSLGLNVERVQGFAFRLGGKNGHRLVLKGPGRDISIGSGA
jgi:hypothetical protein